MPKTSIYKDSSFIFWKYNIGLPRQVFNMQPIPESILEKEFTHGHFRFGVLAPDLAHVVTSGSLVMNVGHGVKLHYLNWIYAINFSEFKGD